MDPSALGFGHIVLVDIPDPEGNPCDSAHPAMILRGPDPSGAMYVVGISTKFESPPGRLMIELPWAEGGHDQTGLSRPCVLKGWWVVPFHVSRVIRRIGVMPAEIAEQAVDFVITAIEEKKRR